MAAAVSDGTQTNHDMKMQLNETEELYQLSLPELLAGECPEGLTLGTDNATCQG